MLNNPQQPFFLILFLAVSRIGLANDTVDFAFVSLADENKVSVFELNKTNASMTWVKDFKVDGDAGSQFFDTDRSILYLGLRNAGKIVAMKFDRASKSLRQISLVKVDRDPAYLNVDASGKWLFAAYYATGRVSVHRLSETGAMDDLDPKWIATAPKAHAIITDSTNRFVFVPHTGPNSIFQFRFESKNGLLRPNEPKELKFDENTGPRHIVAHPKYDSVFFSINEQGSSVTELQMDSETGTLRPLKTESTLKAGYNASNSCSDLEISKNGKYLYGANRGHDSIALFHYSQPFGLRREAIFKTEKTPRQFSLSPDNRFLVVAGQNSNRLAIYRVNPNNGYLTHVATQETGKKPWWITLVD